MNTSSLPSSHASVTEGGTLRQATERMEQARARVIGAALALYEYRDSKSGGVFQRILLERAAELAEAQKQVRQAIGLMVAEDLHQ